MTFTTAKQYEVFRMIAVDAVRGNEVIGKELHTHNIVSDFDFYVDLYTALAGQQDYRCCTPYGLFNGALLRNNNPGRHSKASHSAPIAPNKA